MCLALGVERLDDAAAKLGDILDMQPPEGLRDKVKGLLKLKSVADSRPKTVSKAPCQEVFYEGDQVDLGRLPIQRCWPGDPAPFITLPAVITKDPHTGGRNVGMYRMQVIDGRSTFMHWQMHKDGRADLLAAEDGRIPVAVAIGLDPVTAYCRKRAASEAPRRAHARWLPARRAGRARPLQDGRPRGSGERRDRPRGPCLEGRHGHRGPVRRPHGLLLARGAVSDLPALGPDDAARRRSIPRSSSGGRPRRTRGWARRPSGSSCPPSG